MAHRGDEDRWPPAAGGPVPHGLVNVGDETVKVVGFFSESEIVSTFKEPVQPFGVTVVNQGAPVPAPA